MNPASRPKKAKKPRVQANGLSDEVLVIRRLIHDLDASLKPNLDTKEKLKALDVISRSAAHLANLLKTEQSLEQNKSAADLVLEALDQIRAEEAAEPSAPETCGTAPGPL